MAGWQMQVVGGLLIVAAVCLALGLTYVVVSFGQRRRGRPSWPRMLSDTDYYQAALNLMFQMQGYTVKRCVGAPDPIERVVCEVVFELELAGRPVVAICGRWVSPITSDMVGRFETALAQYPGAAGLIITTSFFSDGALERAKRLADVTLYDRDAIQKWIEELWGE